MTAAAFAGRVEFEQGRGAFANTAHELREYFLCPIPVGGDDGKKPLVSYRNKEHLPGVAYIDTLIAEFPDANVGILCGPSEVTVIDIDDPGVASDPQRLEEYKQRFGDTPLITRTPSGGVHLYYKSSGERNANLRPHGLPVDIKGDGGMVVVPPSVCRLGGHAGTSYGFRTGSWMDLQRLPCLTSSALPFDTDKYRGKKLCDDARQQSHYDTEQVTEGNRNQYLFNKLLIEVRACDDIHALLDVAHTQNLGCYPPLPDQEVKRVTRSVWGYYERGELWTKGDPPRVVLTADVLDILYQDPDGLALYCKLQQAHAVRPGPFKIQAKAMAAEGVIPDFKKSHQRYRDARDFLLANKLIIKEHDGKGRIFRNGELKPDPDLFTFPSTSGPKSGPNITNTPPPWGYGED